jgi:(S)-2-hydroxyglutarate dehydrogenase
MSTHDVIVVGGGIVGVATADALLRSGVRRVVVLEREDRVASGQTGHNSGVIHSGLYYRPGSLKARTCADGRELMYEFCEEAGVAATRCGKLVVATRDGELSRLATLEERGRTNGLRGIERLDADGVRRLEPNIAGVAGLWIAETGVVDFSAVTRALAERVARLGGEVRTGAGVTRVRRDGAAVRVSTPRGELAAAQLVNCAGLQSDRVARMAGADPGVTIIPFRGEYYELLPERADLVRHLVYPVPDPDLPFLGVHFTRRIDGRVEAGPNAVLALKRDSYSRWSFDARDVATMLAFPGFWRMARRQWRTGAAEMGRSLSKRRFVHALQRLMPCIASEDLRWGGCGVRAQAVDAHGKLLDDFHIVESERAVHVINAPSPAATASLSIGRQIAERVLARLGS